MAEPELPAVVVKEMGLTVEEFLRSLPALARGGRWQKERQGLFLEIPGGRVVIGLAPQPVRRLGALEIPVTRVTLHLGALPPGARRRFLEWFDLCFRRGGG